MPDEQPCCFVIQEFDEGGTFDRRYSETVAPTLQKVGVRPQRADQILGLQPVVEKIESAIRGAHICVADVSTDNPNVWLEVGYALALDRPTVILCDKAMRKRLPFDIQHRPVIFYRTDSRSGFDELEKELLKNVKNELDRSSRIRHAPVLKAGATTLEDLKDYEVAMLSTLLALWATPKNGGTHSDLQGKLNSMGLNDVALALGITKLTQKGYVQKQTVEEQDSWGNSWQNEVFQITPDGIAWIQAHEDQIEIREAKEPTSCHTSVDTADTDDLPF